MFGVQFKFRERYAELSTLLRWATEPQTIDQFWIWVSPGSVTSRDLDDLLWIYRKWCRASYSYWSQRRVYCRSVGVLYSSVLPFLVSYSTSIRSFLFFVLRMAFFVKARSLGCCTLHPYTVHILVHVPEITWILVHPNNKWLFCFANRFRKPSLEPPKRGPSVLYFSLQMSYWNIIWLNHHHLQNNTTLQNWLPSGNLLHSYWKWPSRNSRFTHWTWWFPIVFCMFTRGYIGFYHGFSYGFSYGSCFFPWFSHRNLRPRNISLPADEASELLLVTLKYGRVSKEQLLKDFFGFEKMA